MRIKYLSVALSAVFAGVTPNVLAADSLEKITVTARKVEESIQEIPLAITALSSADLERAGVEDLREITHMVAGLQFDGFPGKSYTSPTIRGLSQVSRSDDENNTSVFIDGVYVSGRDGLDSSFLDLERVEVVKGPQGSLYGRNSYAGAINFITKKPSEEFEANVSGNVGNFDKRRISMMLTGSIVEGLQGRVSAAYDDFGGGYENTTDGSDIGGYKSNFASASLQLTAIDNFEAVLSTYYTNDHIDVAPQSIIQGNCINNQYYCGEVPSLDRDDASLWTYSSNNPGNAREISRTSLNGTYDFDTMSLTSISGYNTLTTSGLTEQDRQLKTTFRTSDGGTIDLDTWVSQGLAKRSEWSQEFRLQSTTKDPLQWLIGASYYSMKNKSRGWWGADNSSVPDGVTVLTSVPLFDLSNGFPDDMFHNLTNFTSDSIDKTKTSAVYGALTYDLTEQLTARAELRYTKEEKSILGKISGRDQANTWQFVTPRFSLDYQMNDDVLLYGSIANGSKSGGFNSPNPALPVELEAYDEETNWTYELGFKSDWYNQRLRLNGAIFDVEMDGIQISNQVAGTAAFAVQNAGTGRSKGLELEITAIPMDGLDVSFGYALADSYFVKAEDANLRSVVGAVEGIDSIDISGQQLPRASKNTFNSSIQYTQAIQEDLEAYARFSVRYESKKKFSSHDALDLTPSRTVANAKIGVYKDNWEVALYVDNVFDDDTPVYAASALNLSDYSRSPTVAMAAPRTFGVTFSFNYF